MDDSARVKALDFYFLAKQINKLGSESTDLQTDEGSFVPTEYVNSAVARSDGDQRQNLRRRLNLRNNRLTLPREGGTHTIRETILDDDWQRIRALAYGEDATEDWDTFDGDASATWPAPTEEAWVPIAGALETDDAHERIAKTLSLFGVEMVFEYNMLRYIPVLQVIQDHLYLTDQIERHRDAPRPELPDAVETAFDGENTPEMPDEFLPEQQEAIMQSAGLFDAPPIEADPDVELAEDADRPIDELF